MANENAPKSYEELLERAKSGGEVSQEALESARAQLREGVFLGDPYTLIHLLGIARDFSSADLIQKYVEFRVGNPDDAALVRRIAVQVLGQMWELPESFPSIAFIAFNDESPYVKAVAAVALGCLGSKHQDLKPEAARLLLLGFSQKNPREPEVWESFYDGILQLLNVPQPEWPDPAQDLTDQDVRFEFIEEVRNFGRGE